MSSGWEKWQATGYWVDPGDVQRLMAVVSRVGVWQRGQRFAWRGLTNADYTLTSSLQRVHPATSDEDELRRREEKTIRDARRWGLGVTRYGLLDDLQLLADLQHHGVPTHLVDVTSNPMTALWFACARNTDVAGLLLAVNTSGWREVVPGEAPTTWADMGGPEARAGTTRRVAVGGGDPFMLRVPDPNQRMSAQEGYFISGALPSPNSSGGPIEALRIESLSEYITGPLDLLKDPASDADQHLPYVAIRIRPELKAQLIEPLASTFNRTGPTLFPDYQGFSEWVNAHPSPTRAQGPEDH